MSQAGYWTARPSTWSAVGHSPDLQDAGILIKSPDTLGNPGLLREIPKRKRDMLREIGELAWLRPLKHIILLWSLFPVFLLDLREGYI